MKNVKSNQLKKCIFLTQDEFEEIFDKVFGLKDENGYEKVTFNTFDGISFLEDTTYVYKELSKYFDVEITSIHMDDWEYIGIWICYKENA